MCETTLLSHLQELLMFVEKNPGNVSILIQQIADLAAENDGEGQCGTSILVGRFIEHLHVRNRHTPRTRKRIEGVLRRFCLAFGDLDPDYIEIPAVSCWIGEQGWAPSTQAWVALLIERLFVFGFREAGLRFNTMRGLQSHVLEAWVGDDE